MSESYDPAKLKALRKAAYLTQVELGFKTGVTPNTVARLEQGVTAATTARTLKALAKALGCKPADLQPDPPVLPAWMNTQVS